MNRYTYAGLLDARRAIARVLILRYPEAELVSDLPQELVQAFNIITRMMLDGSDIKGRQYFQYWWDLRNEFKPEWLEE